MNQTLYRVSSAVNTTENLDELLIALGAEDQTIQPTGQGWGSRRSVSSYMYNHIGHFGAAAEALAKSLFFGGVTHRFPKLRVAFLEAGAAWATAEPTRNTAPTVRLTPRRTTTANNSAKVTPSMNQMSNRTICAGICSGVMTDTTPMIDWFEQQHPAHPVMPPDPVQAFVCRLIEDYADEWLWRPAMHYRWHYPAGAHLISRWLADEVMGQMPLPHFAKRWMLRRRQRTGYTTGDGITPAAVAGVEAIYLRTLEQLLKHLRKKGPKGLVVLPYFCMVDRRKALHRRISDDFRTFGGRTFAILGPAYGSITDDGRR